MTPLFSPHREEQSVLFLDHFHIRINKRLVLIHTIEYGFELHPGSFLADCFVGKTIYKPENGAGCICSFSLGVRSSVKTFLSIGLRQLWPMEWNGVHKRWASAPSEGLPDP